mmetsp:Transcript_3738/g.9228  ORF Transcript_3738/g.9228 Transcript_3738/m.9228 type:complete len:83 (+) Transcript_3738:80-328(+)|eukprot:753861-Hanusia_phi.AAC.13
MPVMDFTESDFKIPLFHNCNLSESDQQARAEYNRLIGEMLEREAHHQDENISKNHLFVQGFGLNNEDGQHCTVSLRPVLHSV